MLLLLIFYRSITVFVLKILGTRLPSFHNLMFLRSKLWMTDMMWSQNITQPKGVITWRISARYTVHLVTLFLHCLFSDSNGQDFIKESQHPSFALKKICNNARFNKVERYRQDVRRKIKNKYYHIPWVPHRKTYYWGFKNLLSVLFLTSHSQIVAFDQSL